MKHLLAIAACILLMMPAKLPAQRTEIRPASPIILPGMSDSNSPVHWMNGNMSIIQSLELPLLSVDTTGRGTFKARTIVLNTYEHYPLWIESTWMDDTGVLYAWYHTEVGACNNLVTPKIGALVSNDGGYSFTDLGLIVESAYWPDCGAQNGYFAGGNGDFTVLLDSSRQYFYFYFTNYSGPLYSQGVAVARMAFADQQTQRVRFGNSFRMVGENQVCSAATRRFSLRSIHGAVQLRILSGDHHCIGTLP
jgi:hypothetical protein